jgi:D-alanyl-D-alanine carboxypeptidase/D-alanyl-D-alanine-endopeptidase (penicillin-binding protein 4)
LKLLTGTIANVRALSGYLTTAGGERLVFSIIANNFKGPAAVVDEVAERAVERLVNHSR